MKLRPRPKEPKPKLVRPKQPKAAQEPYSEALTLYVEKLDKLGVFREKFGLESKQEDPLVEELFGMLLDLSEKEQDRTRSEAWRAWPDARRRRMGLKPDEAAEDPDA